MNFVRDVSAVLLISILTAIVVAIGVVAAKARDNRTVGGRAGTCSPVVPVAQAARPSAPVLLRRGGRLRSRQLRSRGRPLCCDHHRRQGRDSERHAHPGAQPKDEVGRWQSQRSRHHLHRAAATGVLLRNARRAVSRSSSRSASRGAVGDELYARSQNSTDAVNIESKSSSRRWNCPSLICGSKFRLCMGRGAGQINNRAATPAGHRLRRSGSGWRDGGSCARCRRCAETSSTLRMPWCR